MIKIDFINMWAEGIIVAVLIVTIIEMILPNNGNGKYVKMVMGVFVLFTIISPIINKFSNNINNNINFNSYIETSTTPSVSENMGLNNEDAIKKMYEENLKIDIKNKILQRGYSVGDINLEILNNAEYTLNKIDVKIIARSEQNYNQNNNSNVTTIVDNIQNIKIDIGGSRKDESNKQQEKSIITESEKRKLIEYLSGVYEVKEANILVN